MTAILERRRSRAAGWSRGLSDFSFVLFAVSALAHHFGLLETGPFLLVLGIAGVLALLGLGLSVLGLSRLWTSGDLGGLDASIGAVVALVVLAPFAYAAYATATHPQISDVTTDLSDPPTFTYAAGLRSGIMNRVVPIDNEAAARQREYYPDVVGRRYRMPIGQVRDIVSAMMKRHGWRRVGSRKPSSESTVPESQITMEAVAYTAVLGFPSDVAVRLTNEGETTVVDMRSASRYGTNDFGDNARRTVSFLDELDLEIGLRTGLPVPENSTE